MAAIGRRVLADPCVINPAAKILEMLRAEGFPLSEDDCSVVVVERIDPATIRMETQIPLQLPAVAEAAAEVSRILLAEGWSEEDSGAAQVVVMEHGTNIIRHGQAPADSTISFRLRVTGPVCRMVFRNLGREWDPADRLAAAQMLPVDRENGRGLDIIHAVTSHAEFFRRENNNVAFFAIAQQVVRAVAGRRGP